MKKSRILAPILLAGLFATSCIGPMNAFNGVLSWNSRVSDSKWLNELVFIPVWVIGLPLAGLGDVLVFNTLEFWGAENPISTPESFTPQEPKADK